MSGGGGGGKMKDDVSTSSGEFEFAKYESAITDTIPTLKLALHSKPNNKSNNPNPTSNTSFT